MKKLRFFYLLLLIFSILANKSIAQQVSLTGKVINPDEKPIKNVLVYLVNNPTLYCYSDNLGNFSLIDEISTSITDVRQNEIISFENRKLSLYANNQSISVDVITINGSQIMNIVNLDKSLGTIGLFPEAYISGLPKAIYIVRARVGNTFQSFKIQNIIPSSFPQGITQYDINNIIDKSYPETRSMTKSGVTDTLVLVHDFYKSRKIPLDSYSMHYDTIHLNNFADYSIAEDFEPSVTQTLSGYGNFTDIFSADSVQFIIYYDTLSILEDDLKVITIPIDKIESLDNSIKFISGLHFEPSGTKFFQPVQVSVLMKDSIPDNLVVFLCNDQGETYFIPYKKLFDDSCSIAFNIHHFSSIGIGTGEIPATNPAEFTTSDQFISYLAKYFNNKGVTEEFFETWYNNIIAPMINNISTFDDLLDALNELIRIECAIDFLGLDEVSFWGQAMVMINEKMEEIWNELIEIYYGLNDNCFKRELLNDAIKIVKLSDVLDDLYSADINDFGNGEFYDLATKIEFSTPVKHLAEGESYVVQYTLKNLFGDNAIPEVVSWSSSNTSVATIDSDGKVSAHKEGETIITGNICDKVKNTFKVEVGGFNCELNYCENRDNKCYAGTYKGTGTLPIYDLWTLYTGGCEYYKVRDQITILVDITGCGDYAYYAYFKSTWFGEISQWDFDTDKCYTLYSIVPNADIGILGASRSTGQIDQFSLNCEGVNDFKTNFATENGHYWIEGRLDGDFLIIDVTKEVRAMHYQPVTTRIHCIRIDQ